MIFKKLVGVVLALAAVAAAQGAISNEIFRMEVSSGGLSDTFVVTSANLTPGAGGSQQWILNGSQYDFVDSNDPFNILATLESATLTYVDDIFSTPRILMNYNLRAGSADITVQANSAIVGFWPINSADAALRATAGFTLSDYADGVDATLNGLDPSNFLGIHHSYYNGDAGSGVEFGDLVAGLGTDNGGTITVTGARPQVGSFENVGVAVNSLYVTNGFTLTAFDLMSGSNSYFAMPEPASIVGLSLLVVLASRRR